MHEFAKLTWPDQIALSEPPLAESFAADWHDPVGGPYSGRWLAAFEPVMVRGRRDEVRDTGWVVVIQERP